MAAVGTKDALAREIQTQIDLLQAELHKHVKDVVVAGNLKRNAHYPARHEIITKAIESGELPRTFWADAIIALKRLKWRRATKAAFLATTMPRCCGSICRR
ncbi:hypothetical protein TcYC6_0001710 [Trypanosoma cruzi]|nr:hypothetical protein TcYC6_0001710 [Trypanosoma cruzi]